MHRKQPSTKDLPRPRSRWRFPFELAFRDQQTLVFLVGIMLTIGAVQWLGDAVSGHPWRAVQDFWRPGVISTIDVNTASVEELCLLPGVGPELARRIVTARGRRRFEGLEQLDRVPGIGPKTLEKLKDYVVFNSDFQDGP